jgi:hypothetical protein
MSEANPKGEGQDGPSNPLTPTSFFSSPASNHHTILKKYVAAAFERMRADGAV